LVHGAGFRDKTLGYNYWGRIPGALSRQGIPVYYGGTDAWGSIENNAESIKQAVHRVLQLERTGKVNIIAHSKGGLEARYLISALGMDYAVASLTAIATPHYGVKAMNIAAGAPDGLYRFISFWVNGWFMLAGDKNPEFFTGSRQLSETYARSFNQANPDKEAVYYQSYAAKMRFFFSDLSFIGVYPLIYLADGVNDGLCPVASAQWGNFRGVITTQGVFGISHSGVVDLYRIAYKGVDIPEYYLTILRDLAERGF
jgi:triacylglycerol lipase